jgi:hypothetical protein
MSARRSIMHVADCADNGLVERHAPWSDDVLRRWFIERAPPLTWASIAGWAVAALIGVALGLVEPKGAPGAVGLALVVVGAIQVFRGVLRMLWLALGGQDQPLKTFLRRHTGS